MVTGWPSIKVINLAVIIAFKFNLIILSMGLCVSEKFYEELIFGLRRYSDVKYARLMLNMEHRRFKTSCIVLEHRYYFRP